MAFRGTFDYSLDQKSRLTVPARFRAALSDGVVLSMGIDPCVEVWPSKDFDARVRAALTGLNPLSADYRDVTRFFMSNSFEMELDSAGRVGVPAALGERASLAKEVVVIGAGDHFQVWDRGSWADFNATLATRIGEITERLGHPA